VTQLRGRHADAISRAQPARFTQETLASGSSTPTSIAAARAGRS
jgi:hypothetical protein